MSQAESADIPWSQAVVMVCTKCSRKIVGDESLADSFKKSLKLSFRDAGYAKNVRTVTSSCLDICPHERVTIAVLKPGAKAQAITVEPKIGESELFEEVQKLVRG